MNKNLIASLSLLFISQILFSQDTTPKGKAIGELFVDFHKCINDTINNTGFSLNRDYFGYNFISDSKFSGTVILNIGDPDDHVTGSASRRYTYVREASISFKSNNLKIDFGITGTKLWEFQQKFWGKRYLAKPYQSINEYGYIADLGIAADYRFNEKLKADITVMNGEGYSSLQLDNSLKTSLGFVITPFEQLAIRVYEGLQKAKGLWQPITVGFIGFKNKLITIGGEATYISNLDLIEGHHAWGFSGTGCINLSERYEIFIRYDYSTSATLPGEDKSWNSQLDGTFAVMGAQYSFSEVVKIALNYQGRNPHDPEVADSDGIYLNAVVRF